MAKNQQGGEGDETILERLNATLLRAPLSSLAVAKVPGWGSDIGRGDWASAVALGEKALEGNGEDIGARLSWIIGQSELGVIPLSALSAPMDELISKIQGDPALFELAGHAALRLGKKLLEKSQYRLGVTLLERSYDLVNVEPGVRLLLWEGILGALQAEQKRATVRRESKQYQEALTARVEALQLKRPVVSDVVAPVKRAQNISRRGFDSKAILERAVSPDLLTPESLRKQELPLALEPRETSAEEGTVVQPFPLEFSKGSSSISSPVETPVSGFDLSSFIRPLKWGSLLVLMVLLLLAAVQELFGGGAGEHLPERVAMSVPVSLSVSPIGPDLKQGGEEEGALSELTKRLQSLERSEVDRTPAKDGSSASDPVEQAPETNAPAEPIATQPSDKLPELDTEKLEQRVVESLGGAGAVVRDSNLTRGQDGRVYGPPPTIADNSGVVQLDGTKLQGYEVEQFSGPRRFKILAVTKVFSAPSVVGQSMAELQPDAVVQGVSRMGRWLEIRSSGGRRGFIYSQDAVEETPPSDGR